MRFDVAYTALARADRVVEISGSGASGYLAARANPGANKRIGATPSRSVVQQELRLTNRGRELLLRDVGEVTGVRLPAPIEVNGQVGRLNLYLRLFPPAIFRVTAIVEGLKLDDGSLTALTGRLPSSDPIAGILRTSLGVMAAVEERSYAPADHPSVSSSVHLVLPPGQRVRAFAEAHSHELVAALIRADPADLREEVVRSVVDECAPLNDKHDFAYTLVARAGILHVSSEHRVVQPDFRALVELQAMALAAADFLDAYDARRVDAPHLFDFYLALVRDWVERPQIAFAKSFSSRLVWERLRAVLGISDRLDAVLNVATRARLDEITDVFGPLREQYWQRDDLGVVLADAFGLRSGGPNLDYIIDLELRYIIRRDLSEASLCLGTRAFKAALVLAGSVAEALLLAAIIAHGASSLPEQKLNKLGLQDLVREAKSSGVPVDPKTLDLVDNWLRHFRNLIHPGKERRESVPPTPERARVAVAAVAMLATELGSAL